MWAAKFLLVAVGVTTACLNNRHVSTSDALGLAAQTKGGGKFSLHPVLGRPIGRKVMEDRSLRASENSEAEKACNVEARKQYERERSARREAHVSSRRKLAGVTDTIGATLVEPDECTNLACALTFDAAEVTHPASVFTTRAYNGDSPGPTLRAKAGDTLVVTLYNDLEDVDNGADNAHNTYR